MKDNPDFAEEVAKLVMENREKLNMSAKAKKGRFAKPEKSVDIAVDDAAAK